MECPACRADMELGSIEVRGPRFGFLFFGLSAPRHLWWSSKEGEGELALQMNEFAPAYLCNDCGTLVVAPERV
jgi:hypothetical protein